MKGEMDFSDPWFRKRFRTDLERKTWGVPGQEAHDRWKQIADWLLEHGVTISKSGKMAYDSALRANNCTNIYWPKREDFLVWARQEAPDIFKKRGAKPTHKGRVTTPAPKPTKPKTTGWDDFDWSR